MISLRDVVTGFGNRDPLAEVWRRDLRGGGSSAEITGTLPLSFSSRGKPLIDYLISGNAVQDGTPTPDAPADVVGCGVWEETRQSYKLPPTVNGTEYPIFLGQVPTTRKIKKLVLTGIEPGWSDSTVGANHFYLSPALYNGAYMNIGVFSTHYIPSNVPGFDRPNSSIRQVRVGTKASQLSIRDDACTTLNDFKSYLAAQYAAGTPVTVWYVLAEPETAVVNEPLMKIGDYADTISFTQAGVTIPTVNGANVLDMTSNVKPSEVYIKGKGIKPT